MKEVRVDDVDNSSWHEMNVEKLRKNPFLYPNTDIERCDRGSEGFFFSFFFSLAYILHRRNDDRANLLLSLKLFWQL